MIYYCEFIYIEIRPVHLRYKNTQIHCLFQHKTAWGDAHTKPVHSWKITAASADIVKGRYYQAFNKLHTHSFAGKRDLNKLVKRLVRKEKRNLGSSNSALQNTRNDTGFGNKLASSDRNAVEEELETKCPTLTAALKGATKGMKKTGNKKVMETGPSGKTVRGVTAALIGHFNNPQYITIFQKLNSLQMWRIPN